MFLYSFINDSVKLWLATESKQRLKRPVQLDSKLFIIGFGLYTLSWFKEKLYIKDCIVALVAQFQNKCGHCGCIKLKTIMNVSIQEF